MNFFMSTLDKLFNLEALRVPACEPTTHIKSLFNITQKFLNDLLFLLSSSIFGCTGFDS